MAVRQFFLTGPSRRRLTGRPVVAYALICGGPCAINPFAAVWLHEHGVALPLLGLCLAAPLLLRPLMAATLTGWINRRGSPWAAMAMLCATSAVASSLAGLGSSWPACIALWAIANLAAGACSPILDTMIMAAAIQPLSPTLSKAKASGALAYLVGCLAIGACSARLGLGAVMVWAMVSASLACAYLALSARNCASCLDVAVAPAPSRQPGPASPGKGSLALAMLAAALVEASHGMHSVAMIAWKARGFGLEINSALWASGTLCDVLFLSWAGPWSARIGPSRLLIFGAATAALRWTGFALSPPLSVLFFLQGLHALSFTATCLALVQIGQILADQHKKLDVQLIVWATSTGLAAGMAAIIAGPLYAALGVDGYWLMVMLASFGLIAALIFDQKFVARPLGGHLRKIEPIEKKVINI